jgi:hypothetical protein
MQRQLSSMVANRGRNPGEVFGERLERVNTSNHYTSQPLTPEIVASLDPAKMRAFYRERFANAAEDSTTELEGRQVFLDRRPSVGCEDLPNVGRQVEGEQPVVQCHIVHFGGCRRSARLTHGGKTWHVVERPPTFRDRQSSSAQQSLQRRGMALFGDHDVEEREHIAVVGEHPEIDRFGMPFILERSIECGGDVGGDAGGRRRRGRICVTRRQEDGQRRPEVSDSRDAS